MKKLYFTICLACLFAACKKNVAGSRTTTDTTNPVVVASDTVTTSTKNFKGVNWADPRDNFADDWVIPSGLNSNDDNNLLLTKTETILTAFKAAGINTVRLPINPPTVLQNWWPKYSAVITKASLMGMKVILAYWEGASSKDGLVDNSAQYTQMWDKIVAGFSNNQNVYFELFNEPHGYNLTDLKELYAQWLIKNPSISRRRILLDGAGYATDVNGIGADSRFDNCLLSFHFYAWFNGNYTTTADWQLPVKSINYPARTVTTEFGVPMTTGKDYAGTPGTDNEINYMQGMTSGLHDLGIGSVYWPGLRSGDSYSMFSYNGSSVGINSASGLARLQYAWGTGTVNPFYKVLTTGAFYKIINKNSGKAVDVDGGSTSNGGNIIQWDYSGGNNQQWSFTSLANDYFAIINKNSGKVLDVHGSSANAGVAIIQNDYSGSNSQQWLITDIGFGYSTIINRSSRQSLDVNSGSTTNGGNIIQWYWNNGNNQQWQIANH